MYRKLSRVLAVFVVILPLAGCLPTKDNKKSGQPGVDLQVTPAQLVEQIENMSAKPEVYGNTIERHELTRQLAEMGPTTLAPLVDFMAAPQTSNSARLFILQCVSDYLTPAYLANIKPMLESKDETVRSTGVVAVGQIKHESVKQLLKAAKLDGSARVSFAALSGLVTQGDADARKEMKDIYVSNKKIGDIPVENSKREAVRVLLRDVQKDDLPILQDALNQPFIEINARVMIAEALGRLGDASAVSPLEKSLNLQKEPEYGEMVREAIAAIKGREGHA